MALAVSGGIDSTVLAYEQAREDRLGPMVFCDFGQPNAKDQLALINKHAEVLRERYEWNYSVHHIPVTVPEGMLKGRPFKKGAKGPAKPYKSVEAIYEDEYWNVTKDQDNFAHIPARNTLIALYTGMLAAEHEEEPTVAMAIQYEQEQWDRMDYIVGDSAVDFFHHLGLFMGLPLDEPVLLDLPFVQRRWNKERIIRHALDLDINLEDTWSCEYGTRCWQCTQCLVTKRAMNTLEAETEASKQLILPFRDSRIAS